MRRRRRWQHRVLVLWLCAAIVIGYMSVVAGDAIGRGCR